MTSIDPISTLASQTSKETKSPTQLGQNEFLKLMLTQLKNQDPMKPLDPSQFLGQLAQFSTVTGIENMNGSLSELSSSLRSSQILNGATLVGREVLAASTTAALPEGGQVRGGVEVPEGATGVQVSIRDSSGQLVRSFSLQPTQGLAEFAWDGATSSGASAPAGTYNLEIVASVGGENVALDSLVSSRVNSVTMNPSSNELTLNTNSGTLALSNVRRVM
jgi:flagellar basal-body rod modification protein FlgD